MEEALEHGIKVLDIGCGPGKWTLEMAKDFPASRFTGTDRAPVFPKSSPYSNCRFLQADTLKGLPFADNTFDYVFQRCVLRQGVPETEIWRTWAFLIYLCASSFFTSCPPWTITRNLCYITLSNLFVEFTGFFSWRSARPTGSRL